MDGAALYNACGQAASATGPLLTLLFADAITSTHNESLIETMRALAEAG